MPFLGLNRSLKHFSPSVDNVRFTSFLHETDSIKNVTPDPLIHTALEKHLKVIQLLCYSRKTNLTKATLRQKIEFF